MQAAPFFEGDEKAMYIPKHFDVSEREEIHRFIDASSFGQLISTSDGRLFSTHVPILLSEDCSTVSVHIARANPQHLDLAGQEVMITLQGPHGYISPTWYKTPGVPTWNYQAVHLYGMASLYDDPIRLSEGLNTLAAKYEAAGDNAWVPEYRKEMLAGIVGIYIELTDIQCKYKLSQNRPVEDRPEIIAQLREAGQEDLAVVMEENGT
jgi:transcriptional regulator